MSIFKDLLTWRFWRHFLTGAFACGGFLSGLIQFAQVIFPTLTTFQGISTLLWVVGISVTVGLIWSWPRPISQEFSAPNTRISIVKGDLLQEQSHLVIGVCDTFDIEFPIIEKSSLQGQVLDTLYRGESARLDRDLAEALTDKKVIEIRPKPGKQNAYGVGAIATVRNASRLIFFLAYTKMNEHNEARATPDDVWKSLLALWKEVSRCGNGRTVSIPAIGGGQSRLSSVLPTQDAIRFIIFSFMFASRHEVICNELRIVVREADYKKLDRLELQSFLSSLRPS